MVICTRGAVLIKWQLLPLDLHARAEPMYRLNQFWFNL